MSNDEEVKKMESLLADEIWYTNRRCRRMSQEEPSFHMCSMKKRFLIATQKRVSRVRLNKRVRKCCS